jgi:hypothetical protein
MFNLLAILLISASAYARCIFSTPYIPMTITSLQQGNLEARELFLPIFKEPNCPGITPTSFSEMRRYEGPAAIIAPGKAFPENFQSATIDSARLVDSRGLSLDSGSMNRLLTYFSLGPKGIIGRILCVITAEDGTTYEVSISQDIKLVAPTSVKSYQCSMGIGTE